MRLLLLGCSGFVGRELVPYLLELGHDLTLVSRTPQPLAAVASPRLVRLQANPAEAASWREGALPAALAAAEGVVNLVGEPIAEKRWTEAHRQQLVDSRLRSTEALVAAMAALPAPPRVLVSGSAVGYYGTSADACFTEARAAGADFLADLCQRWEAAADRAPDGCRVVKLRIGIVLAADGGALGKMLPVFRLGFGGPVGDGRQWMSWIARRDLCRLIAAALEDPSYQGVYNAVAPGAVRMADFSASLGRCLGRPSLLPVPAPVLQLLLGDGAKVVLEGQRVQPERLQAAGFSFHHPELAPALAAATTPAPR